VNRRNHNNQCGMRFPKAS